MEIAEEPPFEKIFVRTEIHDYREVEDTRLEGFGNNGGVAQACCIFFGSENDGIGGLRLEHGRQALHILLRIAMMVGESQLSHHPIAQILTEIMRLGNAG